MTKDDIILLVKEQISINSVINEDADEVTTDGNGVDHIAEGVAEAIVGEAVIMIPENSTDIKRLKERIEAFKHKSVFVSIDISKPFYEECKKENEQVRKETAKEILQTLYDKCYEIKEFSEEEKDGGFVEAKDITELAKHYGVEVEE